MLKESVKKLFALKTEPLKKERLLNLSLFLNGSSYFSLKISEKEEKCLKFFSCLPNPDLDSHQNEMDTKH